MLVMWIGIKQKTAVVDTAVGAGFLEMKNATPFAGAIRGRFGGCSPRVGCSQSLDRETLLSWLKGGYY